MTLDVYTLHHVAASGGSICSAYIDSCSGSILLSEVNPYGWVYANTKQVPHFCIKGYRPGRPLDLALSFTGKDLPKKLRKKFFEYQLEIVLEYALYLSKNVLIRDHTHNTFPFRGQKDKHSTLDLLQQNKSGPLLFNVQCNLFNPILTVRHPLDNFISARKRGWHANYSSDGSFDNYCQSLLSMQEYLTRNHKAEVFRYEDLCINESEFNQQLRIKLGSENLTRPRELSSTISVTGRSGRYSGDKLDLRPRQIHLVDQDLLVECKSSESYSALCMLNDYEPDPLCKDFVK